MNKIAAIVILIASGGLWSGWESSSAPTKNKPSEVSVSAGLQTGDLVLRSGKGLISEFFRSTSTRNKQYSHAGLLVRKGNALFVCHMIGDGLNETSGFKVESFSSFVNAGGNSGFAVYRYPFMASHQPELFAHLRKLNQLKPAFDDHFLLDTDTELYCTEMIYKTIDSVCHHKLEITSVNGMRYVALDDLYRNGTACLITEVKYQ